MTEAEQVKGARAGARGWAKRASRSLIAVLAEAGEAGAATITSEQKVRNAMNDLEQRIGALDAAQEKVDSLVNMDEEALEAEIEESGTLRDLLCAPLVPASIWIGERGNNHISLSSTASSSASVEAKLPKLDLPEYGGDPKEWTSFWEQYESVIDSKEMPDVTKFTYLRSVLKGEARAAIHGLSLSSANYKSAVELLKERFGREEKIIYMHIQELLNVQAPHQPDPTAMWGFYDFLQSHIRSLAALEISEAQYGVLLTPIIVSRLTPSLRKNWARVGEKKERDLTFLLDFLKKEVQMLDRSSTYSDSSEARPYTTSALQSSTTSLLCPLCGKGGHSLAKCYKLNNCPAKDRRKKLLQEHVRACFRCLSCDDGHIFTTCTGKCEICGGKHHKLLCTGPSHRLPSAGQPAHISEASAPYPPSVLSAVTESSLSRSVLLQTFRVPVSGQHGKFEAVVLLDTGSDRSFITESLVKRIQPKWVGAEQLSYTSFGSGGASEPQVRSMFQVNLPGVMLNVTEVPVICATLQRPPVPQEILQSFTGKLADVSPGSSTEVDILIGLDHYWTLMNGRAVRLSDSLIAQESRFGWILSGSVPNQGHKRDSALLVNSSLHVSSSLTDTEVRRFWDLDSIGISDKVPEQDATLAKFEQSVQFQDGRYTVKLPWKDECPQLLNNEVAALKRLDGLDRKLDRTPMLKERYHNALVEMEQSGFIEEVFSDPDDVQSQGSVFYLPHRPVVKESSSTTKIRPVFDASAKGVNGVSLNDCLEVGPSLNPDLPGVLLRFRRWPFVLTGDISKAFLQIRLHTGDRDVHRFLWKKDGVVRKMRFCRVTFGVNCSPFLLNAVVRIHLLQYGDSRVVRELQSNLYVDDWLTGGDSEAELVKMHEDAQKIMSEAGMTLAKWSSNTLFRDDTASKILGVEWNSETDCFALTGVGCSRDVVITKRLVLSCIARVFDPLGFLTPVIMLAKCLFQSLWVLGVGWDEEVPKDIAREFSQWTAELEQLKGWHVPRQFISLPWSVCLQQGICLHVFCDASERGFGAAVYCCVRSPDGQWLSNLVMSKSRVAPLKKVTLPRLELLGCLVGARLLCYVRKELCLDDSCAYVCWSDSLVALSWVRGEASKWKPFVANRVREIQSLTDPHLWRHCPGKDNPADLVTRGISAGRLVRSENWLQGPLKLMSAPLSTNSLSCMQAETVRSEVEKEVSNTSVVLEVSGACAVPVLPVERWSSYAKVIRIVGWIHRVRKTEAPLPTELNLDELQRAKITLLHVTQKQFFPDEYAALSMGKELSSRSSLVKLKPFLGDDGLMRIGGRLQFSHLPYDTRHPVILPKCHVSMLIVRHKHVQLRHAGVDSMLTHLRSEFWIVGARRLCKKVKGQCFACRRLDVPSVAQPVAPLAEHRLVQSPPFSVTGIDHAGPLYCADGEGHKFYVLLLTCAVTRGVHLELTESVSAQDTVRALRRFMARRGKPAVVYSDNARGFVAASKQLADLMQPDPVEWRFIAPRAPWWGGWWERLVRSVKSALKRSVGNRLLCRVELTTALTEIEAILNSRPLTFVGDEPDSSMPLSPANFLMPQQKQSFPWNDPGPVDAAGLRDRAVHQETVLHKFWQVWTDEYIVNLPQGEVFKAGKPTKLQVGALVLIREDNRSRLSWPLATIVALNPGRDGIVRSVELRTREGVYARPVQRVHILEMSESPVDGDEVEEVSKGAVETRSGRVIRRPLRYIDDYV